MTESPPAALPVGETLPIVREHSRVVTIGRRQYRCTNVGFLSVWWQAEAHFGARYHELKLSARQAFKHLIRRLLEQRRAEAERCRDARDRREGRVRLIDAGRLCLTTLDVDTMYDNPAARRRAEFRAFVDEYTNELLHEEAA